MRYFICLLFAVVAVTGPATVGAQTDESAVIQVVDRYHTSLAAGDSTAALELLSESVTILESGGVENKEHYRSGHLSGDMRFAQAVPRERSEISVRILGDVAWATSTSITEGRMGDRDINSQGAELMVLARTDGGWVIQAIHWSSRSRPTG
jgi:ketosteroid isomerase-like protein